MATEKKNSFETKLERLEEISKNLEKDTKNLDQSLELFEEGTKLSKELFQTLKKAKLKVEVLKKQHGKIFTEELNLEDED
jgi:exodeoxyribonuclease VII small subunit